MARKKRKYHYIYKITCIKNQRYYIGMHSTDNLNDCYMGGGKVIKNSVKRHGKDLHTKEILEYFDDRESLRLRESELVNCDLLKDPMCMNLQPGGGGGTISEKHLKDFCEAGNKVFREKLKDESYREEFIEKTGPSREKALLKYNELYKSGDLIPNYFRGKKHSEESILKMKSADRTGIKNSQFGTVWISHPDVGIKKIRKEDIVGFESNGWKRGRKNNF